MLLTKDKSFYRTFGRLFFMIVLQNAIVLSVNLADNLMIGGYSETALSGVAAVNSLQFLYQQLTIGIGDALVTMGSQYWGQGRTAPIKQLGKARGIKNALAQMVDTCRRHTEGRGEGTQRLVLSYCNCLERAQLVRQMIREKCPAIGEIIMTPTSALSSMYAYDGGIVIAY